MLVLAVAGAARADSLNCRLVGTYDTPAGFPIDVAVADSLVYIAAADGGLRIISLADPQNPSEVGFFGGPATAMGVAVKDSLAYLAGSSDGLYIVNVADPTSPQQVGQCGTPGVAASVAVKDTLLYVADRGAGLRIISVRDPASPYEVGFYLDTTGSVHNDVAVEDNFAYVTTVLENLLQVINIADPTNPSLAGSCAMPSNAQGITVSGSYAYVAAGDLLIVDVSNPLNPHEVGRYVTPNFAMDVRVVGNTAYVADGYSGLRVIDVSDPQQPEELGFYDTPGYTNGIDLAGDYVCVTEDPIGLRVFQFYGAGIEEAPNATVRMTNAATIVRGVLVLGAVDSRQNAAYRADLLDISGRKVLSLKSGANDVSQLGSGVYYVYQATDRSERGEVRKVVIQR
jgi:hypothetical protein